MKRALEVIAYVMIGMCMVASTSLFAYDNVYYQIFTGGTMTSPICMAGQTLYLDSACSSEYLTVPGTGQVAIWASSFDALTVKNASVGATQSRNTIDLFTNEHFLRFLNSTYGRIHKAADDGTHFCSAGNTTQNNNWILTTNANCGADHNHELDSVDPTMFWQSSTAPGTDDTEWGSIHHDGSSFVVETGTGPLYVDAGLKPGEVTSDPCGDDQFTRGAGFYNYTGDYWCFCNQAGVAKQMHSPATNCF